MKRLIPILILVLAALLPASPARGQGVRRAGNGIVLNFQDVDLAYVISSLAQVANLNVMYSDLPTKNITLRTPEPITMDQVVSVLRDIAASNGISMTQGDGVIRMQGQAVAEAGPPRQLYIHRLKHARAPILSQTLQSLFGGVVRATSAAQAANTLSQQLRQFELQQRQQQLLQQQQAQNQQFVIPNIRSGDLQDNVTIVPDEVTNSLLVRATPNDWQIVQQAIMSLDLRPLQVMIEVVIAEVRRNNDLSVGVNVAADRTRSNGDVVTGELVSPVPTAGLALGLLRTGNINIDATLTALASTGNVRILSRPVVLAQNNQEAYILVGSERPFVQVSQAVPQGQTTVIQTVQYRDVGTRLTITPTINEDGYVNLAVTQEVSAATTETQFDAPVISTREAQTQLFARNGQTVVLGGLVDTQEDKRRSGIPFLRDIPILGFLFGSTQETTTNSELFLFLTPYIVATDDDADRIREQIESRGGLLKDVVPIEPLMPRVVRLRGDTLRIPPDTSSLIPPDTGRVQPADTSGTGIGRTW
jgi:type II secretory pathway component GspD/PulD (secretin)